ncbi:hypothetical protein GGR57DRAFT_481779 [Xylariaceae sp. FL1272]|nr:hypothetical protein GGR57DRAFT_481779 [Xylariaceae sp. FL1272]
MSRSPVSWLTRGGESRYLHAAIALAPVLIPTAYVAYTLHRIARRTTASTSISPPDSLSNERTGAFLRLTRASEKESDLVSKHDTSAIPRNILAKKDQYVISCERIVSEPVSINSLPAEFQPSKEQHGEDGEKNRRLLEAYLSTTMRTFTRTPQAYIMKSMVSRLASGANHAATFSESYLTSCRFEQQDRVCGVYVVRERVGAGRVLLDLSPPQGWKGAVVTGVLDCGFVVEEDRNCVRFVNETIMWRRKHEAPTLLEGSIGRWFHGMMVRWMVVRGVESVRQKA